MQYHKTKPMLRSSISILKTRASCDKLTGRQNKASLAAVFIHTAVTAFRRPVLVVPRLCFQTSAPDLENKDYYKILGLPRNSTKAEIKKKYFELVVTPNFISLIQNVPAPIGCRFQSSFLPRISLHKGEKISSRCQQGERCRIEI